MQQRLVIVTVQLAISIPADHADVNAYVDEAIKERFDAKNQTAGFLGDIEDWQYLNGSDFIDKGLYDNADYQDGDAFKGIQASTTAPEQPMVMIVKGGVVHDVTNIPPGHTLKVYDFDVEGRDDVDELPTDDDGDPYATMVFEGPPAPQGIYPILDCSTGHITEAENDWLTGITNSSYEPLLVNDREYGFWIHVPLEEDEYETAIELIKDEYPNVAALLEYAHKHNCWWICLDNAAGVLDNFPLYEW